MIISAKIPTVEQARCLSIELDRQDACSTIFLESLTGKMPVPQNIYVIYLMAIFITNY